MSAEAKMAVSTALAWLVDTRFFAGAKGFVVGFIAMNAFNSDTSQTTSVLRSLSQVGPSTVQALAETVRLTAGNIQLGEGPFTAFSMAIKGRSVITDLPPYPSQTLEP